MQASILSATLLVPVESNGRQDLQNPSAARAHDALDYRINTLHRQLKCEPLIKTLSDTLEKCLSILLISDYIAVTVFGLRYLSLFTNLMHSMFSKVNFSRIEQ